MPLETFPFDPAEYLDTPEAVAEYLAAAFESGEHGVIADALGHCGQGARHVAIGARHRLGPPRAFRALSPNGHPEFETVLKVLRALGVTLKPTVTDEFEKASAE